MYHKNINTVGFEVKIIGQGNQIYKCISVIIFLPISLNIGFGCSKRPS